MKHRLRIAIELPPELHQSVLEIQSILQKISPLVVCEDVNTIQIVTNNLGQVDEQRIPGIVKALAGEIEKYNKFTIQPHFLSTLYNRHEPSVVYLEPTGEIDVLKELQKTISYQLSKMSLPSQNRFQPLYTIARVNRIDPTSVKQILDKIHELEISPLPTITIDHLSLYETNSTKNGQFQRKMGEFTLA